MSEHTTPLTLPGWASYYAEPGTVLSLSYLSPPQSVCRDDARAYRLLRGHTGIAGYEGGLGSSVAAKVPRAGWQRAGDVWVAWVQVARGATLGSLLPTALKPCSGVNAEYRLQVVIRHRAGGNWFQVADAKVTDAMERNPGDVIGDATADVVGGAADVVVRSLLPIAVPLLLGFVILNRYGR